MAKKKKYKERKTRSLPPPSHPGLAFKIAGVYFVIIGALIFLTYEFKLAMFRPEPPDGPSVWFYVVMGFYYVIPFLLGIVFGLTVRPFWRNFRNLVLIIFFLHGVYSLVIYSARNQYVDSLRQNIQAGRSQRLVLNAIQSRLIDLDSDGIIEKVEVFTEFDLSSYPDGAYEVYMTVTQNGEELPDNEIGYLEIELSEQSPGVYPVSFEFDPRMYSSFYSRGPFELNAGIVLLSEPDEQLRQFLQFARWAAFLKYTGWDGADPVIDPRQIEVDYQPMVGRIELSSTATGASLEFIQYLYDEGVDYNGNGRFEQFVLVLEVAAKYEGMIFITAGLEGSATSLYFENHVAFGRNQLEFIIDGEHFKNLNTDGPYRLTDVVLFNEDPTCEGDACLSEEDYFEIYLEDYLTKPYAMKDFE